jgi:DNA-binding NtrC family response regulator
MNDKGQLEVLIVDDEPQMAVVLGNFYARKNYEPNSFQDPIKAYHFLRDKSFDLLHINFLMPTMNGTTFIRKAYEDNLVKNALVILDTGIVKIDERKELIRPLYEDGMIHFILSRPYRFTKFSTFLDSLRSNQLSSCPKEMKQLIERLRYAQNL